MINFLQFVCAAHLGRPSDDRGRGEWYWECPKCGGSGFHTRPYKEKPDGSFYKDYFSCFSCGWWGDDWDFLRHMNAAHDYDRLLGNWVVLQQIRLDEPRGVPMTPKEFKQKQRVQKSLHRLAKNNQEFNT